MLSKVHTFPIPPCVADRQAQTSSFVQVEVTALGTSILSRIYAASAGPKNTRSLARGFICACGAYGGDLS
nr:hypothetical protein CFP56_70669 [Quercus suber]